MNFSNKTIMKEADHNTALKGIKSWAEADRPREKMLTKSNKALSDAELLAIVLGSGSNKQSAVELSRTILGSVSNDLVELAKLGIPDLLKFKGIGKAKATNIAAVMELGRRRRLAEGLKTPQINSSKDAFNIIQPYIGELPHEELWIMILNSRKVFRRMICVSEGSMALTIADPKKIFRLALENHAACLVIGHNHPSGIVNPSKADDNLTKKCTEAGKYLDMPVIDHIIVAGDKYFSFADEGMMG